VINLAESTVLIIGRLILEIAATYQEAL